MTYSFSEIRLLVPTVHETFIFYRDVLGFECVFGQEDDVYATFKVGEVYIALFERALMAEAVNTTDLPPVAAMQDTANFAFAVPDVDAEFNRLLGEGVEFLAPPTSRPDWGLRTAHFRDPGGNLLEIHHRIPME